MRHLAPFVLASLFIGTTAHADLPHDGLMVRLGAGFGFDIAGDSEDVGSGTATVSISGLSGAVDAAIGGYVAPKLALGGNLWASATPSPEITISDDNGNSFSGDADGTMSFFGLGGNITYWIGHIDLFLAGTVGVGRVSFTDSDGDSESLDWGLAVKLGVGKLWAIGPEWGIGVSGDLTIASLEDEDSDDSALWVSSHVYFTATFH